MFLEREREKFNLILRELLRNSFLLPTKQFIYYSNKNLMEKITARPYSSLAFNSLKLLVNVRHRCAFTWSVITMHNKSPPPVLPRKIYDKGRAASCRRCELFILRLFCTNSDIKC